ncbi:ubiquinol-cytochrome C chaperone family protein [Aquamicrobium sp. LC103]|uniref:ubiquinol-cytochrome C chaperone family protein n=1 Tax=Aquamicrobium sp. LC103 TaxID=1120658 RepID=UPI00063EABD0|nr:ubiquinol-cytochrome C chaperone family protein [Aquamicrobium sp. LC103]TKT81430.1 ubiquinol-cytochrome C chaperone [Aquamicrobium sp. LC103]
MFKRLFGLGRNPNRAITNALYEQIVAAARQPAFYSGLGVPDTPLGRFEMLSVHMFLFLQRARGEAGALSDIAQELTDEFFLDVEHSLRELGIGDVGVPKRMKKLAKMFYGRAEAYREAVEKKDAAALAAALKRNVRPDVGDWPEAAALARYVETADRALAGQGAADLVSGKVEFPQAGEMEA